MFQVMIAAAVMMIVQVMNDLLLSLVDLNNKTQMLIDRVILTLLFMFRRKKQDKETSSNGERERERRKLENNE